MRIYLDCCCLQRPFDDQTQGRIRVETEAVLAILSAVEHGTIVLLGSEVLDYEIDRIPYGSRQQEARAILALAGEYLQIDDPAEQLALALEHDGIQPIDALHLALASTSKANYFATTDDRLLRKAQALPGLACNVTSLLGLVAEIEL
jgi:predicted nucleic acid-binding protein